MPIVTQAQISRVVKKHNKATRRKMGARRPAQPERFSRERRNERVREKIEYYTRSNIKKTYAEIEAEVDRDLPRLSGVPRSNQVSDDGTVGRGNPPGFEVEQMEALEELKRMGYTQEQLSLSGLSPIVAVDLIRRGLSLPGGVPAKRSLPGYSERTVRIRAHIEADARAGRHRSYSEIAAFVDATM
jgi:hypothetical protein